MEVRMLLLDDVARHVVSSETSGIGDEGDVPFCGPSFLGWIDRVKRLVCRNAVSARNEAGNWLATTRAAVEASREVWGTRSSPETSLFAMVDKSLSLSGGKTDVKEYVKAWAFGSRLAHPQQGKIGVYAKHRKNGIIGQSRK